VFVSEGENVHEANATASILTDTAIDLDEFLVDNVSDFTRTLCSAKNITYDEVDWHASL